MFSVVLLAAHHPFVKSAVALASFPSGNGWRACVRDPIKIFTVNIKIVGCDPSGYLSLHLVTDAQRWRTFFKGVQTRMSSNFVKPASWKGEPKPSEFVSCPDSYIKPLISDKPLVKFKTSRFRTRGAAVSLCVLFPTESKQAVLQIVLSA